MSTLIFAAILTLLLLGVKFTAIKNSKTLIMAGLVMALLLLNIIDELTLPDPHVPRLTDQDAFDQKSLGSAPAHLSLNISSSLYRNSPSRNLIKEERNVVGYLKQRMEKDKEDIKAVVVFNNIEEMRFRAIFKEFQTGPEDTAQYKIEAFQVDYRQYDYERGDLEAAVAQAHVGYAVFSIIQGVATLEQLSQLESLFLIHPRLSLLLLNPPSHLLQLSPLSNWASTYNFQGNYIAQVLENHPPRLVEICSKYRTIDYSFYIMSQSEPLSELCTKSASNSVTECIREHLSRHDEQVPYSQVRQCWGGSSLYNVDGVVVENGMVGVKKDYFYAGRVDKKEFLFLQSDNTQNL